MSALTEATIIVEAGETSGTLIQARAAFIKAASCSFSTTASQRADLAAAVCG